MLGNYNIKLSDNIIQSLSFILLTSYFIWTIIDSSNNRFIK
nr:MAG TPA: hypothetical protein [Caudoviricetes sp.]